MDLSYIINHLGEERENYYNAVSPPIMQTSNFYFKTTGDFKKTIASDGDHCIYTRDFNPTIDILNKKMAALEGTEKAITFGSGMAAISTAIIANVKAGDHIICVKRSYSWTAVVIDKILAKFNVSHTYVDGTDINNFKKAIRPNTSVIYLESPTSLTFDIQDIEKVTALAKKHKIVTMIDNTYSGTMAQSPAKMGVDIVLHSASKYLGGHSDVVAGVLCTSEKMFKKIYNTEFLSLGGIISPFNAWLLIRGLRTLPVRINKISDTTKKIMKYLNNHPKVERILYPLHPSHPQYKLAKKQIKHDMGLFSLILKTKNTDEIEKFCNSMKYFVIAVSWGGHESLVLPACIIKETDLPRNLVRFYIGLDEPEVLIKDLDNAFKFIKA